MKSKIAVATGHMESSPNLRMALAALAGAIERLGDEITVNPNSLIDVSAVFLPWVPGVKLPDLGQSALPIVAVDIGEYNDEPLNFETAGRALIEIIEKTDFLASGTFRLEHCLRSIRNINQARTEGPDRIVLQSPDILFVENDPAVIVAGEQAFRKVTGGEIVTVKTVEQARASATQIPIVILDGDLGAGGSYRKTDQLADELMGLSHRPIVFRWSGSFGEIRNGCFGVLPKPLRKGELKSRLTAVASVLNRPLQLPAA